MMNNYWPTPDTILSHSHIFCLRKPNSSHFTVQYWIAFSGTEHKPYALSLFVHPSCISLLCPVLVSMETVVNVEGATWQDTAAYFSQHALALMEENPMRGFDGARLSIGGGNDMINSCITLTNAVSEPGHLPHNCVFLMSLNHLHIKSATPTLLFNSKIKALIIIIIKSGISKRTLEMYNIY